MARFDVQDTEMATMGGENRAEVFCEMGLMYATGRGCAVDLVAAHKWLNIAAIKGSERAAALRAELSQTMDKSDLAVALRAAGEWMTMHGFPLREGRLRGVPPPAPNQRSTEKAGLRAIRTRATIYSG